MLLRFYDYLFYIIYKFYAKHKDSGAETTSATIVAGLQSANILTLLMVASIYYRNKEMLNNIVAIILFIIFGFFTYIRYVYKEKNNYKAIEVRWKGETEFSRERKELFSFAYLILSVVSLFGVAAYLGSQKY